MVDQDAGCLYEKRGRIVVMTLDRPHRRNALDRRLMHTLRDNWIRFKEDDDACVAILWGGEGPSFCAGQDLVEVAEMQRSGASPPPAPDRWSPVDLEIWKPTIAAVNGYAVAGGIWLTATCHLCVAADTAEFGVTETRWNIGGRSQVELVRLVGVRNAMELTLSPGRVSAQRAREMGLVNWVVPKGDELAKALEVAEGILELGQESVRAFIESYDRTYGMERSAALDLAGEVQRPLREMDSREGPRAFAEGRRPDFSGR